MSVTNVLTGLFLFPVCTVALLIISAIGGIELLIIIMFMIHMSMVYGKMCERRN